MCDTLCIPHTAGMWFAKNSDRHPGEAQLVEWHDRRDAGADRELRVQYLTIPDAPAFSFCGSRPTWLWGCEHGVNQHGLAVGNEKIWTVDRAADVPPALIGMDVVRLVLERAKDADAALEVCAALVERYGQGGSGEPDHDEPYFSSFLLADARRAWVVETSNRTWVARPAPEGGAISNRVTIGTDWTRASSDIAPGTDFDRYRQPDMPTIVADDRLAVTRTCVRRGATANARDIAQALRDHGGATRVPPPLGDDLSGFTVCMHRPESHAQTTASMIVDLRADGAPLRGWACLGNPCASVYVPFFPPAITPELADAAQWKRFASLRDQVEGGALALEEVQASLGPVEAALWDEADALHARGHRDELDRFARTAFHAVDAALGQLGA
jgi:dipeptidase